MQHVEPQIRDWLKALSVLIAPSMSGEEIRARINALVPHLASRFSSGTFCPGSLTHTAELCKFFPNFAELCEALGAWQRSQNPYPIYGGDPGYAGYLTHDTPPPEKRGAQNDEQRRHASELVRSISEQLAILGEAKRDTMQAQLPPRQPAAQLSRAQLVQAYKQAGVKGPQIPEPTPLRAAASTVPTEVRRGPVIDAEPPNA